MMRGATRMRFNQCYHWRYDGETSTIDYKNTSKRFLANKRTRKTEEGNETHDAQAQGSQPETVRSDTEMMK